MEMSIEKGRRGRKIYEAEESLLVIFEENRKQSLR